MVSSSLADKLGVRWLAWRNRTLADPRFQRFAARFWLTRPVARRRARALFDIVAGFTYSQTLFACVETGLLDLLASGPLTLAEIAARIAVPAEGTDRLLRAAAALGLAQRVGDRWTLGSDGAALRGNGGIAEMVAHHRHLYADLADPVALLRRGGGGGELSSYWTYAESTGQGSADAVAPYSALMAASQPLIAETVLDSYRFDRHRSMLDIGGGEGAFLTAAGNRAARLQLALFDLPAVGARAQRRLDSAGLGDRTTIHGGNFLTDALPAGHDLVTLIRVLHDHDDDAAAILLRSIYRALPKKGRLLIAEPMAETRHAEPSGDAYFGLYLWAMGSGRPRSPSAIAAMLKTAGFRSSRLLRTPIPLTVRVIVADH